MIPREIEVKGAVIDINGAIKIKNSCAGPRVCLSGLNQTIVKIQRTASHVNIAPDRPENRADHPPIANNCIIYCDCPPRYGDDAKQIWRGSVSSNCKTIAIDCDFSGDDG